MISNNYKVFLDDTCVWRRVRSEEKNKPNQIIYENSTKVPTFAVLNKGYSWKDGSNV